VRSIMPQSTQKSPVRNSMVARTSAVAAAGEWSTAAMGGASPGGGGTWHRRAVPAESVPRATSEVGAGRGGMGERTSRKQGRRGRAKSVPHERGRAMQSEQNTRISG
jgi:hypothetical protein